MTTTMLLYIVMGIGAGFCVAAALGARFLLPSPKQSANETQGSEQPNQRDTQNPTVPTKFELDIGPSNVRISSPAPEDVRDQAIAVARSWHTTTITPGQDWDEAIRESIALAALRMAQEPLNLDTTYVDYRQFIDRSRPEDIEEYFLGVRRHISLT
jgi:hypothetical protein